MKIDPARMGDASGTGIFVRAQDDTGKWHNADIACLDTDSLISWLRSRGGYNPWAESVVLTFLKREDQNLDPQTPLQRLQAGLGIAAMFDLHVDVWESGVVINSKGNIAANLLEQAKWTTFDGPFGESFVHGGRTKVLYIFHKDRLHHA